MVGSGSNIDVEGHPDPPLQDGLSSDEGQLGDIRTSLFAHLIVVPCLSCNRDVLQSTGVLLNQEVIPSTCPGHSDADGGESSLINIGALMRVVKVGIPPVRPKVFFTRPAYLELDALGLVELPDVQGVSLSCHVKSQQWHSIYPGPGGKRIHHAPAFGTVRPEREALLLALHAAWNEHQKATGCGEEQLAKLAAALKEVQP